MSKEKLSIGQKINLEVSFYSTMNHLNTVSQEQIGRIKMMKILYPKTYSQIRRKVKRQLLLI